jgi:ferritin-like metal-binding protein YciE
MVTLVGNQQNFSDALKDLIELEYAAVDAYDAAITRLENSEYKTKITGFKKDHEKHIEDLSILLKSNNQEVPKSGNYSKELITTGKVVIADLLGDEVILRALRSNEIDTNTAYERMNERKDKWPDSVAIIAGGLHDERRHKEWLDKTIT